MLSPSARSSGPWPYLVVALSAVASVFGVELLREHEQIQAEQVSRLESQANVVMDNLSRQLEGVKNALDGIRDDVVSMNGRLGLTPGSNRLKALADAMPGVRGIMVLDGEGTVQIADRQDLARRVFSDRNYFRIPKAEKLYSRLYVSAPFRSVLGRYSINITRAFPLLDGTFGGIVTANIDAEYVEILARSVLYSADMHVSILDADGEVFLDVHREAPALVASNFEGAKDALTFVKTKPGVLASAEIDVPTQGPRLTVVGAMQPSSLNMDRPLLIAVSRSKSDVYAPWRQQLFDYGVFLFLLSAGTITTLYLVEQRRRAVEFAALYGQRLATVTAQTLQSGLEGADLGFWQWNARTDTISVNPRELQILGYPEGELELKPEEWKELIPADEWKVFLAAFKNVKASTAAFSGEHHICHKDGKSVWVQSHAVVTERDAKNRPLRIVGTHLDISAKKAAELAVQEAAKRFELAMETGEMGLVDLDVGSGQLIMNARGYEIVGWPLDDPMPIAVSRWRALIHPEDVENVQQAFEPTLAGSEKTRSCEYRLRHASSHWVWVKMRARAVGSGENGKAPRVVGAFQDISDVKHAEARLDTAAELQRRTGQLARVGGWKYEVQSSHMTWTDELYDIHELAPQPVTLESSLTFYVPEARTSLKQAVEEALNTGSSWCIDAEVLTAKGRSIWVRTQGEAVVDDGIVTHLVGASQDITERINYAHDLQLANEQLERLTLTDGLTGVGNRRLFDKSLQAEWQRCGRAGQTLGLMMVDIDYFKAFNDTYGHQQGDAALMRVAELLQRCVQRSGEMVARYGGEEFVVLLPGSDIGDLARVANVFAALLKQANIPHIASSVSPVLTVSIGIAAKIPTPVDDPGTLLAAADSALYQAKGDGRNRIAHASQLLPHGHWVARAIPHPTE